MTTTARGAIAAGHPVTAAAGARVLERGGNAMDACVAAACAAFVAETPLTGAAGGGFLFAHVDGEPVLLDCFFAVPAEPLGEIESLTVDFGSSTQSYHVGPGSVAVPGLVAGLVEAHARWGRTPWAELVEPSLAVARAGVDVTPAHAFLHEILEPLLLRDEGGRRIYGATPGRCETADLVETLEALRDDPLGAVRMLVPELAADLDAYRPVECEPLHVAFAGREALATPPPSRGGVIVVAALEALEGTRTLHERALALQEAYARAPVQAHGTTHISVVDAEGNAFGLSSTLGAGSGVHRAGSQLNNMLGEWDVVGYGPKVPGERLASMMTPTLLLEEGRPRLMLGSAGSVRLSGAIAQVVDLVVRGTPLPQAIAAPRFHVVGGTLHLEGGWPPETAEELPAGAWELVPWQSLNLYFGGVQAVELRADGTLLAAGDPRRDGLGIVVP